MNDKQIKRYVNAKRRKGLRMYPHGIQIAIPNIETGEVQQITFKGSFDRRKLRRMVRNVLVAKLTTEQIDWIIDTYGTKLRQLSTEEVNLMLTSLHTEGDGDG